MIIYRYLSRELLANTVVVASVLVLILACGRFIKYLSYAAAGSMVKEAPFLILLYKMPSFLELILPIALFLGILLAYGRLYVENEMAVLSACGMSRWQLLKVTGIPIVMATLIVGVISMQVSPWANAKVEYIFSAQETKQTELQTLAPGVFHSSGDRLRVTYVEKLGEKKEMQNVFMSERFRPEANRRDLVVLSAQRGERKVDSVTGAPILELYDGYRYEGVPGEPNYRKIKFDSYELLMAQPEESKQIMEIRATSTRELAQKKDIKSQAELHWRITLALLVPVVGVLAIGLSKVNPRQGRYLKMFPSIVLYLLYLSALISIRNAAEGGKVNILYLHTPHVLFLLIGLLLISVDQLSARWRAFRSGRVLGVAA
ncbi:MAG TPA: LPS export ABC transporter permease LptF [Pseudomonadales bacterium]|nr:LPS export ABC transporter permease LptF [Pseudomonadales bacterium]